MKQKTMLALAALVAIVLSGGVAWAGPSTTAVPEPTSLSLLAVAIGGAAWAKFRRRK